MPELIPLVYLAVGALGGWVLAEAKMRAEIAEREAHAALSGERVVKPPEEFTRPHRARLQWLREQTPVLAVLAIACYGLLVSADNQRALDDQGSATEALSKCVKQQLLEYVVGAEEVRKANRQYRLSIAALLNISFAPDATEVERRDAGLALRDAANAVNEAYRLHPLPTEEDVQEC